MTQAWIGLNDQKVEGKFEWIINHNSKYTNWYNGLPNGYSNSYQDCVAIYYSDGSWWDSYCSVTYNFICEIP